MNRAERVIKFLERRPNTWISATEFEPVGGRQAWRTAISEARQIVESRGGKIENRTRVIPEHGGNCAVWRSGPADQCNCNWSGSWKRSEYRYLPAPKTLLDIAS